MSKPRKPSRAMPKTVKAWGGFCDNRLHSDYSELGLRFAIYPRKDTASEYYEDVRRVLITPLPEKRNGR